MLRTYSTIAVAAAFAATNAFAQSDEPPLSGSDAVLVEMDIHVSDMANDAITAYLDEAHSAVLKSLALQHAYAANCEEFEIDETRNADELAYVFEHIAAIEDEDEKQKAVLATMMGFSAYIGGQHAIAAYDYSAFCRHAVELLEEGGEASHIILVAAE
ncbi:hypothetical protein AAFO92_05740 [Roseovarius sp. CAU 1744]|uniref:hypothetical protein n=1 Tax=Roseovarius sp. CAU 1744 TaxID=3140368 RepID=UPI00325AEC0E